MNSRTLRDERPAQGATESSVQSMRHATGNRGRVS